MRLLAFVSLLLAAAAAGSDARAHSPADAPTPPTVRFLRSSTGFMVAVDNDVAFLDAQARPTGRVEDSRTKRMIGDAVTGAPEGLTLSIAADGVEVAAYGTSKTAKIATKGSFARTASLGDDWFIVFQPTAPSALKPHDKPLEVHLFNQDLTPMPLPIPTEGLIDLVDTGNRRIAFRHVYEKVDESSGRSFVRAEIYDTSVEWKVVRVEEAPGVVVAATSTDKGAFALVATGAGLDVVRYDVDGKLDLARASLPEGITALQPHREGVVAHGGGKMFLVERNMSVAALPPLAGSAGDTRCRKEGCAGVTYQADGVYASFVAPKAAAAEPLVKVLDVDHPYGEPQSNSMCSASPCHGGSPLGGGCLALGAVAAILAARRRAARAG